MDSEWGWMTRNLNCEERRQLKFCLDAWPSIADILSRLAYHLTPVLPATASGAVSRGELGQLCLSKALNISEPCGLREFVSALFAPLTLLAHLLVWQGNEMPIADGTVGWLQPPDETTLEMAVWPPSVALGNWRSRHPGAIGICWNGESTIVSESICLLVVSSVLHRDEYYLARDCVSTPERTS